LNSGSLDLYGSLLINNGTILGTTNVNFGALAKAAAFTGESTSPTAENSRRKFSGDGDDWPTTESGQLSR
jgi:hypothetical protein